MLDLLARTLDLGSLLAEVKRRYGAYDLLDHWTQGEFHHDVVLRLPDAALRDLPGNVLVCSELRHLRAFRLPVCVPLSRRRAVLQSAASGGSIPS
jgi:hypothetical protein